MHPDALLLGIDGGGTRCRARLTSASGAVLGEAVAGPANIRHGLEASFAAVLEAANACLRSADLQSHDASRIIACVALAGASEPTEHTAAQRLKWPFGRTVITSDAHAACIGAHGGRDGGIVVIGTGSIAWGQLNGRTCRFGGWGLPVSDEGSGAWLGQELLRQVLWARDGRAPWTPLLDAAVAQFGCDPHAIVRWVAAAAPRDLAGFAPLVADHAERDDAAGCALMSTAAFHVDALAERLAAAGIVRLSLVGGLAGRMARWVSRHTASRLVPPAGDAIDGALQIARGAADAVAA